MTSQFLPYVIGICGGSGSGKTTLAKRVQEHLGSERVQILSQDSYYHDLSSQFDHDGGSVNFDHPDALEFSLMSMHLEALKTGSSVEVPKYDFATHKRKPNSEIIYPKPVIIVDGILILSQEHVRKHFDRSVFLSVPEEVRLSRRLKRDVAERGRTPQGVVEQFHRQVKPMHDLFVEPFSVFAETQLKIESEILEFVRSLRSPGDRLLIPEESTAGAVLR